MSLGDHNRPVCETLCEDDGLVTVVVAGDGPEADIRDPRGAGRTPPCCQAGCLILRRRMAESACGDEATRLRTEYAIVSRYHLTCMLPLAGLVGADPEAGILYHAVGGRTCNRLPRPDPPGLITLAEAITTAVGEMHTAGILHRDLRPGNILVAPDPARGNGSPRAWIIDFGRAIVGRRDHKDFDSPWAMAHSLVYAAPEQTGRMNRPVDDRADYYALGVILYELATGAPPFFAADPLRLMYEHLAVAPEPPQRRNPALPPFLAQVILKLLAKDPDHRYQTTDGLLADLKIARAVAARPDGRGGTVATMGRVGSTGADNGGAAGPIATLAADSGPETVGAFDGPSRFRLAHRLYGRDPDRTRLLACFDRACQGSREMVLIAGYSGVGKTSLIRETYIPVTRQKAYFVAGKFDQLQRRVPYAAWIQALRKLMTFVLAEPEDRLRFWIDHLAGELGQNGGVLADMIPELVLLLGPQAPPPELPPAEAFNRFNQTFRAFIGAFCAPERPLVVFLDDLQWIDAASLNLLNLLIGDPECRSLFLIGAYRDNEVSATHPLVLALDEARRSAAFALTEITLRPLTGTDVEHLIAETLAVPVAEARPLAAVIGMRTAGNPFFLWQFLQTARTQGLVVFDQSTLRWTWRLEAIRQLGCAGNVAELMLYRFHELPASTQSALSWAACLGARFDIATLAALLGETTPQVLDVLTPAIEQEFVLPLSVPEVVSSRPSKPLEVCAQINPKQGCAGSASVDIEYVAEPAHSCLVTEGYRFLHDRVQEAAYQAIPDARRPAAHHRIAVLLLADTADADLAERIFEIVDHLNLATDLMVTDADRLRLARLNLLAGCKAKESAAFEAALGYLRTGMATLPAGLWESERDLARALFRERGDLEYLNSHFDAAEAFVREALDRETDPLHRTDFYHMLVVQYTLRAFYGKAIATAREGLRLLSVALPEDDFETARDEELAQIRSLLAGRPLSTLADLPVMDDPVQRAVMLLLTSMGPPCYRSHPRLWGVIVAREIRLCLEYGNVPSASYSYPAFGGLLTHVGEGTARECADLASVTLTLMQRFHTAADTSVGYLMIGSSLRHWFQPLEAASRDYLDAYRTGLESGNLQYAAYGFGHNTYCRFYQGVPLGELLRETGGYHAFCRQRNNLWGIDLTEGALRVFATLRGREGETPFSWQGEPETAYLDRCEAHENLQVLCVYHILKTEALLHLGAWDDAGVSLSEAGRRLVSVSTQGLLPASQFHFLRGVLLAVAPGSVREPGPGADGDPQAGTTRDELRRVRERFKGLSDACPETHLPAYWLLVAEECRLDGDIATALDAYDQAMDTARRQGARHRESLAGMLAARFWRERGKAWMAGAYLDRAVLASQAWQADAVADRLSEHGPREVAWQDRSLTRQRLDLRAMTEMVRVLSRPLALEDLVAAIIQSVARLSGAQRVVLVLALETGLAVALDSWGGDAAIQGDPVPLDEATNLPRTVVHTVARTRQPRLVGAGTLDEDGPEREDPYLQAVRPASALCVPLVFMGALSGALYLEHRAAAGIFGATDNQVIEFAAMQAAISIHRSTLLGQLQDEIRVRRETEDALRHAHADLKRFADVAAHHLMEPARRLVSFAQRLRHGALEDLDEDARLSLGFIEEQAGRLRRLLQDIQLYLAIDEIVETLEVLDAGTVARTAVQAIARALRDVGAVVNVGVLPPARTTSSRLASIFEIVLDNAVKYRRRTAPLRIDITGIQTDTSVCYRIADNGIGIPAEYRERVFRVFERLHPRPGDDSTGIGLAIVRRIAEKNGGRAWVEETSGGGVTVCIELPSGVVSS